MKTKQKIILGFSFLAFGLIFAVGNPQKAFAAEVNEASFRNTLYRITAFENNRPKTISVNIAGRQFTFTDSNTSDNDINLKSTNNNFFICEQSSRTTGITITGKAVPIPGGGDSYAGFITVSYKDDTNEKCNGNADKFLNKLSISAVYGSPVAPGTVAPPKEATTEDQCNESFWSFTWAFCPIISAIDGMFGELNEFIQEQLSYDIKKYFTADTKRTWSVIRTIATSVLVIIMLVMVFSQAINAGIFDAYTVRKLLPRLVVAAILIQVSYDLFIWVITLANNAGSGIYDLLAVPFGGHKALELDQLIGKLGGGGTAAATTLIPAMLGAGIVIFNPFGVLLFGFAVLLAVLVAAATLLIRNVLILACIILVPLALVAWILPGTNRYWKLWWDNFTKLLLLFPIIMAIIVVGRIFAYTVASSDSGIFVWLAVLVGFFGPYFLLPKAFRWGGSIMAEAGKQINGAGDSFGKRPREFLKGRQEGYHAMKLARSQERVARGDDKFTRSPTSWIRSPVDKLRSGKWDPTLGLPNSSRRERGVASYVSKGLASEAEDIKVERDKIKREWESIVEGKGITKDDYLQDMVYGKVSTNPETGKPREYKTLDGSNLDPTGRKDVTKRAALDDMAMLAGATNYRHIESMFERVDDIETKSKNGETISKDDRNFVDMFTRFKNDNVSSMMPKITDMYKGVASAADAGPQGVAGQHGVGIERMLSKLSNSIMKARVDNNPAAEASAVQSLNNYLSAYLQAAENDNLRGGMELGGTRAVKAFLTNNPELQAQLLNNSKTGINTGEDGRANSKLKLDQIDVRAADAVDTGIRARLDALIKDDVGGGFKTGRELQAVEPGQEQPQAGNTQGAQRSGDATAIPSEGVSLHSRPMGGVSTGGGTTIISPTGAGGGGGISASEIKKGVSEAIRENANVFQSGPAVPPQAPRGLDINPETGTAKPAEDDKP